ncbi:unnamed protein product [Cunninghamella blakesleeana]
MIASTSTATKVMTPLVLMVAGFATYARITAQPTPAYSHIMTSNGADKYGRQKWKEINNGLSLTDAGT